MHSNINIWIQKNFYLTKYFWWFGCLNGCQTAWWCVKWSGQATELGCWSVAVIRILMCLMVQRRVSHVRRFGPPWFTTAYDTLVRSVVRFCDKSKYSRDSKRSSLVETNALLIGDILVLRAKCPHHKDQTYSSNVRPPIASYLYTVRLSKFLS